MIIFQEKKLNYEINFNETKPYNLRLLLTFAGRKFVRALILLKSQQTLHQKKA